MKVAILAVRSFLPPELGSRGAAADHAAANPAPLRHVEFFHDNARIARTIPDQGIGYR